MYAVIADGGKQYMVRQGQTIFVETRDLPEGETSLAFNQVMLVGEGDATRIGQPFVDGASVTARLDETIRGPKQTILKFRRRKGYRLKKGHRQNYLKVTVESINA